MPRRLKELAEFKTVRDLVINNYVEYTGDTAYIQNISIDSEGLITDKTITFEQLYRDVSALGTFLVRDIFLSSLPENAEYVSSRRANIAILGDTSYRNTFVTLTIMSGIGTALPIPPDITDEKLKEVFADLNIKHIFAEEKYLHKIPSGIKIYPLDEDGLSLLLEQGRKDEDAMDIFLTIPIAEASDICIALPTNGENGGRKFACHTNRTLVNSIHNLQSKTRIGHFDRFVSVIPTYFYYEFVMGLLFPLSRGSSVVYGKADTEESRTALLKAYNPTLLVSTPCFIDRVYSNLWSSIQKNGKTQVALSFIQMVENAGQVRRGVKQNVVSEIASSLGKEIRTIFSSGNTLSARTRSGMKAFGVQIIDVYGMAECPVVSVKLVASDSDKSLGDIVPNINVSVNSAEHNGIGRIRIRGSAVTGCYCNERHNKKYIGRDGWISTGDIGTITSDGKIHIIGKSTTMFESAKEGRTIYPEQLERTVSAEHDIAEVLVYCEKTKTDDVENITVCAKVRPEQSYIDLHGPVAAKKMVRDTLERINSLLLPFKRIEKHTVVFEPLERSTSFRLKR